MKITFRDKVFNYADKIIDGKNYLNKNNMIYLSPNYKYIEPSEKIPHKKFNYALFTDLKSHKFTKDITSKNLISTKYPYLMIIHNKSENDNVLLLVKTPKVKKLSGGMNSQFSTTEAGKGFSPDTFTTQGIDLGQYRAPTVPVEKLPSEFKKYDHNLYPADQMFDNKEMESLVDREKLNYTNYEDGFTKGFDSGYHKGYYFGYSAASAYLYRFYKKYYSDYMNKYEMKFKEYSNRRLAEKEADINEEKRKFLDEVIVKNELNADTLIAKSREKELGKDGSLENFLGVKEEEEEDQGFFGSATGGFFFNSSKYKFYDYDKLETKDEYDGLPYSMRPENLLSLEALQPPKTGIFYLIDMFLDPPPITESPYRHCYKPSKEDLDNTVRKLFNPRYRDAIVSSEEAWDQDEFNKSCNRRRLKNMKYCPHVNHVGVEYDAKVGKFKKICKKDSDEDIFYEYFYLFLGFLVALGTGYYFGDKYFNVNKPVPPPEPLPGLDGIPPEGQTIPLDEVPGL